MGSVNKVILVGNLGADPELKYTPSNRPVCNLNVATNEVWKDKSGQKQERVEWHRVNVWGDQAEHCSKYLSKGRQVYIEGKLQTRKWQDKEGKNRYSTEVVAERVVFLGGGDSEAMGRDSQKPSERRQSSGKHREERYNPDPDPRNGDDDVPF